MLAHMRSSPYTYDTALLFSLCSAPQLNCWSAALRADSSQLEWKVAMGSAIQTSNVAQLSSNLFMVMIIGLCLQAAAPIEYSSSVQQPICPSCLATSTCLCWRGLLGQQWQCQSRRQPA